MLKLVVQLLSVSSFASALSRTSLAAAVVASASAFSTFAKSTMDPEYPGTAVERMNYIREQVRSTPRTSFDADWEDCRRAILHAGGLKDLPNARPGHGYTGHSFQDFNHCDLTAMRGEDSHNENEGRVDGIAFRNPLGTGIKLASLPEHGPGGSWSTCMIGCQSEPPKDVAHVQFRSRIAFKLVWCPPSYSRFVLVDDAGHLLNKGSPSGTLPPLSERKKNFQVVVGSKYAVEAELFGIESDEKKEELRER
jgi:hypothetical protein